jgi:hypothetical protein
MEDIKLLGFSRTTSAFNYVFEGEIPAGETIYVKLPAVSANKRGINDIGWASDAELDDDGAPKIKLWGTLAHSITDGNAIWQEIRQHDEINKCTSVIKVTNIGDKTYRIEMRAIFN